MLTSAKQPVIAAVVDITPHVLTLRFRMTASTIVNAVDAPVKAKAMVAAPHSASR
jgi:hypothetical protein